jgi:hypothetical protein
MAQPSQHGPMVFEVVDDSERKLVRPTNRGVVSEWMKALIEGKTIKIAVTDRNRIGGNTVTLRKRGLRLRSGMVSETEVILWTERMGPDRE